MLFMGAIGQTDNTNAVVRAGRAKGLRAEHPARQVCSESVLPLVPTTSATTTVTRYLNDVSITEKTTHKMSPSVTTYYEIHNEPEEKTTTKANTRGVPAHLTSADVIQLEHTYGAHK
jgi:hypothetical protein